jgi:hypothetical protein
MTIYAAAMGPVGAPLNPGGGDVSATQVAGQVEQRDAGTSVLGRHRGMRRPGPFRCTVEMLHFTAGLGVVAAVHAPASVSGAYVPPRYQPLDCRLGLVLTVTSVAAPNVTAVRPATGTSTTPGSVPLSSSKPPAARAHDKPGSGPGCAGLQTSWAAIV